MSALRRFGLAALAACALALPVWADSPPRVLALVTSADPQVQGMAFVLLGQMRQQGMTVEVMLCGEAAHLARREPPGPAAPALRPSGATPAQMFANLVRAGARAEVCALYLPNAGVGPEALIEGVRAASPPEMARRMLAEHTRVLPF
jgi:predicted peroxiredoxin